MNHRPDLIELFIRRLERAEVEYMITGGVAAVIYGDPRFTRDVDVVLEMGADEIPALFDAFEANAFYLPPPDTLRDEVARSEGGHFNVIHRDSALRADVYLAGEVPLHRWALDRAVRLRVGEGEISVAPIEYVIIRKLEYFRNSASERHLRDIAMMLRFSGDVVDREALDDWCRRLDLAALMEEAEGYDPDL